MAVPDEGALSDFSADGELCLCPNTHVSPAVSVSVVVISEIYDMSF